MIPLRVSGIFTVSCRVNWVRQWYEALGWRSARSDDVFVSYPLGGMTFALWSLSSAAPNVAAVVAESGDFSGTLLCTVVDRPEELDAALDAVARAGGRIVVPGHDVAFGRSGWFLDPAGTTWEVAWIDGCSSAAPFAGSPAADAVAVNLLGAIIPSEDPDLLAEFYGEGLGWGDAASEHGGNRALSLEGGTLVFVGSGALPPRSSAPVALLAVNDGATGEHPTARFVRSGAVEVSGPVQTGYTWLADPFGVHWVVSGPAMS